MFQVVNSALTQVARQLTGHQELPLKLVLLHAFNLHRAPTLVPEAIATYQTQCYAHHSIAAAAVYRETQLPLRVLSDGHRQAPSFLHRCGRSLPLPVLMLGVTGSAVGRAPALCGGAANQSHPTVR
jgi:hypothetical protein